MQNRLYRQLQKLVNKPKNRRYLIAASGGLDSTVLIDLCYQLKLDFSICHVNFQLRGQESNEDQKFLENLAEKLHKPIYALTENAKTYAQTHKCSTQEAARIIRYNWFETCIKKYDYDYLLTAHHADDNLETFLINSFRGTGLKGLTGIPSQRDYILRPLLKFTRKDILYYAKTENLKWREDQSNASDNYLRNVIRHHLLPFFEKRNDNLNARFDKTLNHINRQHKLLEDYLQMAFKHVVEETDNSYKINIQKLQEFPLPKNLLIEWLKDFQFSDWDSIYDLIDAQVGKYISSPTHKLVKERGYLELFVLKEDQKKPIIIQLDHLPKQVDFEDSKLHFEIAENFKKTKKNTVFISKDLLKTDLLLRPYKIGDYFCPLGMQGSRKLSDFLKDEKLSTLEKSKVWVLTHHDDIVWVINYRIDDRYKITNNTTECLKITFSE